MSEDGYSYPNMSNEGDKIDVLRNKMDIRTNSDLSAIEYRITAARRVDIELGRGPAGKFDATHLKAIHRHLFSEIYEWAGHTRNERPIVDGQPVEVIATMRKDGHAFLHGSRIETGLAEALRPISNPDVLKGSSIEQFADTAARVLAELNHVHPFREGNGRAQEAFIAALGREYDHKVDFTVITKPRMITASIETSNNPASQAMRYLIEDATEPGRAAAIKSSFEHLWALGHEHFDHYVRTGRPGETVTGSLVGTDERAASLVTNTGIVAVPKADLPAQKLAIGDDVTVTIRSPFQGASAGRAMPANQVPETAAAYWTSAIESGRAIQASESGSRQGYEADRYQGQSPAAGR